MPKSIKDMPKSIKSEEKIGHLKRSKRVNFWQFSDREFLSTPSVKEGGMSMKEEAITRVRACRIVERVGKELGMPQDQLNIGKILLHRFYMRCSLKKAEYHEVAAAILFLSGKLGSGSNFVKIDKVIHYMVRDCIKDPAKKNQVDTREGTKDYKYWSNAIFHLEDVILEKLCFDDHAQLPHTYALELIRQFQGSKILQHTAFLYCSDALCTTISVRYSPKMIAYAAVYAAVEATSEHLVTLHGTEWWVSKGLGQNHLKVLAMEITLASDLIAYSSFLERAKQKMTKTSDTSPLNFPGTPFCESSPISNSDSSLTGSARFQPYKASVQKTTTHISTAAVTSFF